MANVDTGDTCAVEGGLPSEAMQLLADGKWAVCMQLIQHSLGRLRCTAQDTLEPTQVQRAQLNRTATQALAICGIHLHAVAGSWYELLGATPPSAFTASDVSATAKQAAATAADIRRAFRRTAALVHPDKCALPHAAPAFHHLQHALQSCLPCQRAQQQHSSGQTSTTAGWESEPGTPGGDPDAEVNEEGEDGGRWWEPWDVKPAPAGISSLSKRSTQPTEEDLEPLLWEMPIQVRAGPETKDGSLETYIQTSISLRRLKSVAGCLLCTPSLCSPIQPVIASL